VATPITPVRGIKSPVPRRTESPAGTQLLALVHAAQILAFAAALATGILLFSPSLRAAITSGYSTLIGDVHQYSGRAQVLLALVLAGIWAYAAGSQRLTAAADRWRTWRVTHVVLVSVAAVGLGATGIVLSSRGSYPLALVDYSFAIHLGLTYMSCAVIAGHVFVTMSHPESRRFFALRTRAAAPDTGSSRAINEG
jgi:hypothetical protein